MRKSRKMDSKVASQCGPVCVYATPAGQGQVYVTARVADGTVAAGDAARTAYRRIAEILADLDVAVVHERVLGSIDAYADVMAARNEVMPKGLAAPASAVTYAQGRPCWGEGLAGVSIHAVRPEGGASVQPIMSGGKAVGRSWRRNGATFMVLQNIHGLPEGSRGPDTPQQQARRMFERAEAVLRASGATYRNVVRTWIYLSGLLDWYDEFNNARNEKYRQFGIMPDLSRRDERQPLVLPASTGIEGDNPLGAACTMDLLAVIGPPGSTPDVEQMTNVKQEDAFKYGSAFSRGAYLAESDVASILISGTAAIDEAGRSLCPGDVAGQIRRTFDNVETLIAEKGATLRDICDANVFLKRAEDLPVYLRFAADRGLADIPAVIVNADVCRPELLFEIDAVAIVPD